MIVVLDSSFYPNWFLFFIWTLASPPFPFNPLIRGGGGGAGQKKLFKFSLILLINCFHKSSQELFRTFYNFLINFSYS